MWFDDNENDGPSKTNSENLSNLAMMLAFSHAMSTKRTSEDAVLKSEARIQLDIQVSKKPHFIKLLGDDDTRVLYVNLKAEDSTYKTKSAAVVEFKKKKPRTA